MLRQLVINNLAVIDNLNLEIKSGMTVLTGETGAGKSILLDAIGLILGDRADSALIRGEKDKTEITAVFSLEKNPGINELLNNIEIDTDNDLFIRRTISKDGRSRAYLNNTPVPVQSLRDIGEQLIDIHGQHAHQSLSRSKMQLEILDSTGKYKTLIDDLNKTYEEWKNTINQSEAISIGEDNYEAKLSLLKFQIDELTQLDLNESEYKTLSEEHKRLSNAQHLLDVCNRAYNELHSSEQSIESRISTYHHDIAELCNIDNSLSNTISFLENASIQIDEACNELRNYIEQFDSDVNELSTIESRLNILNDLSRKYKVKPEQLIEHLNQLTTELERLEGGREAQALLQQKMHELTEQYFNLANQLHLERIKTAKVISIAITEKMHELGMSGKFNIRVDTISDHEPHKSGMDKITFEVSTNPGQPLRPITKVASGGELSRLSLAIQIISMQDDAVPTMIFDEVDAGISGGIAEIVGKMLSHLAEKRQILCVTHLAQVASCGDQHLQVNKSVVNDETFTQVVELDKNARIDEVARMLAGMKITDESRANAVQMLETG